MAWPMTVGYLSEVDWPVGLIALGVRHSEYERCYKTLQ
jgi:hypothetical protein